jgi:hypothetical protein
MNMVRLPTRAMEFAEEKPSEMADAILAFASWVQAP